MMYLNYYVNEKKRLLKEGITEGEIDLSLLPSAMRDFAAFDQGVNKIYRFKLEKS